MNVIFYSITKKHNSTAVPTGTGTTISCDLKDSCSIMSPSLTLNLGTEQAPSYNYCYISAFGRYYFIDDWDYFQGLWTCSLSIDVLATYKTAIGNASLYVLRSASQSNKYLIDTTYPVQYKSTAQRVYVTTASGYFKCNVQGTDYTDYTYAIWNTSYNNGYVILGVTEEQAQGVTYYCMNVPTFKTIFKWLIDSYPTGEESWLVDIGSAIKKAFYKPLSYITTCYWIPSAIPGLSYTNTHIYIGEMELQESETSTDWVLSNPLDISLKTPSWFMGIDLPEHPQASSRGYWLDNSPYTDFTLDFLPFGSISLPMAKLASATSIVCRVLLDIPTGNAELYVNVGTISDIGTLIYHTSAKWGADLPIASTRFTTGAIGAAAGTIASGLGGVISGGNAIANADLDVAQAAYVSPNMIGSMDDYAKGVRSAFANRQATRESVKQNALESIPTAIGSLASSIERVGGSSGSPGSMISFYKVTPSLYAQFFTIADEDLAHRGRPLCAIKTLNTLSGFIKCNDGDVDLTCTQDEKELVRAYLTNGFFYE